MGSWSSFFKHRSGFIKYNWTSEPHSLNILGEVVRYNKIGNEYEIGIAFRCVDESDIKDLTSYLESLVDNDNNNTIT